MSLRRHLIALAGAGLLAGCVTVFPKTDPAQLYRFELPARTQTTAATARVDVVKAATVFDRAAQGDAILTFTGGGGAAYIGGSRWVSPAAILFDDAVDQAFTGGPVRLLSRGELGKADSSLRLDVKRFEVNYAQAGAAPVVRVEIDASLVRLSDRSLLAQRRFSALVPVGENRVGTIVPAFNAALAQVLPALADWTASAAALPPPAP